jgi:peptidoglycan hydrolase CwlO-like protein
MNKSILVIVAMIVLIAFIAINLTAKRNNQKQYIKNTSSNFNEANLEYKVVEK